MKTVRVGLLLDKAPDNAEEADIIVEFLRHKAGLGGAKQTWFSTNPADLARLDPNIDLLVFDYGALHHAYGDALHRWTDSVRHWCEAHPGRLALAYSVFTVFIINDLRADIGEVPDNLLLLYESGRSYDLDPRALVKLRAWFAGQS